MLIGEFLVYTGIRRPSVRQHFQTTSPLKPCGRFFPYYTHSIQVVGGGGGGGANVTFLFLSDNKSGCYADYSFHRLMMKVEIDNFCYAIEYSFYKNVY